MRKKNRLSGLMRFADEKIPPKCAFYKLVRGVSGLRNKGYECGRGNAQFQGCAASQGATLRVKKLARPQCAGPPQYAYQIARWLDRGRLAVR